MAKEKKTPAMGGAGCLIPRLTRFLLESDFDVTILGLFPFGRRHLDPLLKKYPKPSVHFADRRRAGDLAEVVNAPDAGGNPGRLVRDPTCSLGENELWLHNISITKSSGRYPELLPDRETAVRVLLQRGRSGAVRHVVKRKSPVRFLFCPVRGRTVNFIRGEA